MQLIAPLMTRVSDWIHVRAKQGTTVYYRLHVRRNERFLLQNSDWL